MPQHANGFQLEKSQENKQQDSRQENEQAAGGQDGTPLSAAGQVLSNRLDEQIQQFEEQLQAKSNSELKQISTQLEQVEREMLLEKIDNELKTIKDTVVRPGDITSTAAAGATAAAIQVQSTPIETP